MDWEVEKDLVVLLQFWKKKLQLSWALSWSVSGMHPNLRTPTKVPGSFYEDTQLLQGHKVIHKDRDS